MAMECRGAARFRWESSIRVFRSLENEGFPLCPLVPRTSKFASPDEGRRSQESKTSSLPLSRQHRQSFEDVVEVGHPGDCKPQRGQLPTSQARVRITS
jgi:hypothetical protein